MPELIIVNCLPDPHLENIIAEITKPRHPFLRFVDTSRTEPHQKNKPQAFYEVLFSPSGHGWKKTVGGRQRRSHF